MRPHRELLLAYRVAGSAVLLHLTYLGCEGVLIRSAAGAVLIDALFGEEAEPFGMPPAGARDALRHARPPFDAVDAVIATHFHGDHLDADAVADYLRASRRARFLSTPQAAGRVIDAAGPALADRVHALTPVAGVREAAQVNGVRVECFGLSHGRVNYADVEHLGVVVRLGGRSILHLGDGIIDEKTLRAAGVLDETADVAVLPFWYLTYPFGRRLMQRSLRPRATFAVHIRASEREQIVNEIASWSDAVPLTEPMSCHRIDGKGRITRKEGP